MKNELKMMEEVMYAITQMEEWERIKLEDPQIKDAEGELAEAIAHIRPFVPVELINKLEDASGPIAAAYGYAGILYGIQVADAIHAVAAKPTALSWHILSRLPREIF